MNYVDLPDAELITLIARRDKGALEAMYDRYAGSLYSVAVRLIGNQELAQEIIQEVFLSLWLKAGGYQLERGKVSTWLFSMAHHRAVDELRKARRNGQPYTPLDDGNTHIKPESWAGDAEFLANLDSRAVREAISDLPQPQQQVIVMSYFQGLTQSEIADRLQVPLGTVKSRVRSGLSRLRDKLKSQGVR